MIFPWQAEQWEQLSRSKQENRLPHALLFAGIAGTGKAKFADSFSRLLLCQLPPANTVNLFCNTCHACRLIAGRAHPNVVWVEPEKEGHAIKVDQIREVNEFINQSSLQGDYRVVIINPANAMNNSAANALLKTLEEPSSGAIIILISHQGERLPATILSRCQRITFPKPKTEQALDWVKTELKDNAVDHALLLNLANGAPLAALKLADTEVLTLRKDFYEVLCQLNRKQGDPIKATANVLDAQPMEILDLMLSWITDLLRLQLDGTEDEVTNKDYAKQLAEIKQRTQLKKITHFVEFLLQMRGQISQGINLNKQLMIESLLIRWTGL